MIAAAVLAAGAVWYYHPDRNPAARAAEAEAADDEWIEHLYSQNPKDAAEAVKHVEMLGERAVPIIKTTLQSPDSDREQRKAALKAVTILGVTAAPALPEVAALLPDPELTAEAALALTYLGRGAFAPLRDGVSSDDPIVRRESLRSIGKLKDRAPLDTRVVLPILLQGMKDPDAGVRAVAATYLGIVHEGGETAVPALVQGLEDSEMEVRRASAEALGSFGDAAAPALPALRRTQKDKDPEVAREAGLAIVKLQTPRQ